LNNEENHIKTEEKVSEDKADEENNNVHEYQQEEKDEEVNIN
jgi:hypothetical protein